MRNDLQNTNPATAFENLNHSINSIEDWYPAWHPALLPFHAMVLAFI